MHWKLNYDYLKNNFVYVFCISTLIRFCAKPQTNIRIMRLFVCGTNLHENIFTMDFRTAAGKIKCDAHRMRQDDRNLAIFLISRARARARCWLIRCVRMVNVHESNVGVNDCHIYRNTRIIILYDEKFISVINVPR